MLDKNALVEIQASVVEAAADFVRDMTMAKGKATYPADHQPAMRVPKGGSSCISCEYVSEDGKHCGNEHYQAFYKTDKLPYAADEFCSDWYEPKKGMEVEGSGTSEGAEKGWDVRGRGRKMTSGWVTKDGKVYPLKNLGKYLKTKSGMMLSQEEEHDHAAARLKLDKGQPQTNSGLPGALANGHVRVLLDSSGRTSIEANTFKDSASLVSHILDKLPDSHDNNKVMVEFWHRSSGEDSSHLYRIGSAPELQDWIDKGARAAHGVYGATEQSAHEMHDGGLWHGIRITGFNGPEEEGLRAMLSRVPPELLFNVKEIKASPELNAKHGRYDDENKVISFNPSNFQLRQRFGKGPGWILHQELTIVHEVGHSLYKALSTTDRHKWLEISGWMKGTKPGQAPAYVESRPGWPAFTSDWTHKVGVKFTRYYAEKSPNEDFADSFAFFLLSKAHQMSAEKRKFMEQYIKAHVKAYPSAIIQSPSRPYGERHLKNKKK